MYLVDTSVWIDYFQGKKTSSVESLEQILDAQIPFGITSCIYQELLQGVATHQEFIKLNDYLLTQIFYNPKDNIISYQLAAKIYFDCRKNGITIRSTIDCLIVQIAIEHSLILLHNDADFEKIRQVTSKLKLAKFGLMN